MAAARRRTAARGGGCVGERCGCARAERERRLRRLRMAAAWSGGLDGVRRMEREAAAAWIAGDGMYGRRRWSGGTSGGSVESGKTKEVRQASAGKTHI